MISKKQLKKIGERIRNDTATDGDFKTISNLRSNYIPLTRALRDTLKNFKQVKELKDSELIISRRIKRMPSIVKKIKRFPSMQLDRIQDLGGVRVVLSNIRQVNTLAKRLREQTYKHKDKNNFLFIREKNYILEPKTDGYRSIHQVYRYQGKRLPELNGLDIELQIRTKQQHQWATAVEILDMVLNSSLKLGDAEEHYKTFFELCSYAITYIENNNKMPDNSNHNFDIKTIVEKISILNEEHSIFDKLLSVSVITNNLSKVAKQGCGDDYLLLELDKNTKSVRARYSDCKTDLDDLYLMLESKYKDDFSKDVVMVSVSEMKKIKKAYPNYFLDAKGFIKMISALIDKINK